MCYTLIPTHMSYSPIDIFGPLSYDKSSFFAIVLFVLSAILALLILSSTTPILSLHNILCIKCPLCVVFYLHSSYFVLFSIFVVFVFCLCRSRKVMRTKMKEWENTCACVCSPVRAVACVRECAGERAGVEKK